MPHSLLRFVSLAAPSARRLVALALAAGAALAQAQTISVPRYEEDAAQARADAAVPLPAFPKPENLLRFPTNWTGSQIFIDTASLVFGDGEILSYTLLVRGEGGAENYSFESLRCTSGERRVMAYGRKDGTWLPARNQGWQQISDKYYNRYYFEFYRDVFCSGKTLERKNDVLANIRRGGRERTMSLPD